jgi:hypothetical protein
MKVDMARFHIATTLLSLALLSGSDALSQSPHTGKPKVPKLWDDAAMSKLEVPLANPVGSPKHVSSDYYYRIPTRPIYKQYPVYAPGREPAGYMDRLKDLEPVIVWDDSRHKPKLKTEADWVKAGEIVFSAPILYSIDKGVFTLADVQNKAWYEKSGMPLTPDGVMPFLHYVIREKGKVELGSFSCAMCHTRLMADGTLLKGAQGSFPFSEALAQSETIPWPIYQGLFSVPWLHPDPMDRQERMSDNNVRVLLAAIPPGVLSRHRSSLFEPVQVPDLIGVKDRHYLDRTGLQQHRSEVDLMRYAALNQGGDSLSSFAGFVPADIPNFKTLPEPTDPVAVGGRYSDEQLYALSLYIYSLKPPPNPNKFNGEAVRGQKVFSQEGCGRCHTPPLYTNNKLMPAPGFTVPEDHRAKYDVLPMSVGTDPDLTLKTRRGTGYYKVPSLKGVWYRSMFGHSGWCATLEDWFDPNRVDDDYVPTGFKPYGVKAYSVKGHPFGLDLSAKEKADLIAFLKTL